MVLTRIYVNGDKVTLKSESTAFKEEYDSVQDWQKFNSSYRLGCGLFIDGKCVYNGYLNAEQIAKYEAELSVKS